MLLSAATIALSAFLLFQVQPMIAKMILPWFGGSAAVWITAMLFFQTALLGGYLYAHWSVRRFRPAAQARIHAALLALSLLLLPAEPSAAWKPSGSEDPVLRILVLLALSIGLPYFLLSATSPLVQVWHSRTGKGALTYRLFALSNLASLLGLLAYPFLVEPHVTLRQQSLGWSAGYVVFAALCSAAAFSGSRGGREAACAPSGTEDACALPTVREQLTWLALAACASTLLLAVTNHLTQNVASIPFLWVLPLGLYLLTFILTFDLEGLYRRRPFLWLLAAGLAGMAYGLANWNSRTSLRIVIPVFCGGLFLACMFCHGELVRRKPSPRHLTTFYLMLSLGGALGGLLVGLAAPRLLPATFELPFALVACAVLMLMALDYRRWRLTVAVAWAVAVMVVASAGYYLSSYAESTRIMVRNFYGGLRVTEQDRGTRAESRTMVHGTVIHGKQFIAPDRRRELISYYGPTSGIALAARTVRRSTVRAGVIGLGAGSLAAYARPGDRFRFYEINPLVEDLARREFTYLADCRGTAEVALGDGRLSLERERPQEFDLLAVDAFSGDSIPVHLLTVQALEVYFRHLRPDGILALHITNSHLDLVPVVQALARALGKHAVLITNERDGEREVYESTWALLTSSPAAPALLEAADEVRPRPDIRVWTDDHNNLFEILK